MLQAQAILGLEALRRLEQRHRQAVPALMERAGAAAAKRVLEVLAQRTHSEHTEPPLPPLIVAGSGNNGGDALVVARLLRQHGLHPVVAFAGHLERLPPDAAAAYQAWIASGGSVQHELDTQGYGLVVDGLLGIGLQRPLDGQFARWVETINAASCPVVALDIPSGLDAETGKVLGVAVRATHTASFLALKPGLLTLDGPDHCGAISVHDLGIDATAEAKAESGSIGLSVAPALFAQALRPRRRNSHKGSYGSVAIIGGAPGMAGAALLAGRAALQLGAGRVYVGMLEHLAVDCLQPELMLRPADAVLDQATCLAVGPGLGTSAAALALLRGALQRQLPLLLDADALNLLASHPALQRQVLRRQAPTLLTPHPAEAARLLCCSVEHIRGDRLSACRSLAARFQAGVVLKGCGSIIAFPDGRWFINCTGNPGLASAGTGDVLTGIAAAFLAQNIAADQALLAAVYVHGAAAEACVEAGLGPTGLCASDIIPAARQVFNSLLSA